jgi:hypothetical protein
MNSALRLHSVASTTDSARAFHTTFALIEERSSWRSHARSLGGGYAARAWHAAGAATRRLGFRGRACHTSGPNSGPFHRRRAAGMGLDLARGRPTNPARDTRCLVSDSSTHSLSASKLMLFALTEEVIPGLFHTLPVGHDVGRGI